MQKISLLIISLLFCASAAGIEINAGPDRIVCEGQSVTLETVVSGGSVSTICWFDADTYTEGATPLFIGETYSFTQTETKSYLVKGKDVSGTANCDDIVTVVLPRLSLQEVSFHNNHRIEQDPPANGFFDAPQYLNIGLPTPVSHPICYSANSTLQTSIRIRFFEYPLLNPDDLNSITNSMQIKGKFMPSASNPDQTVIEIPPTNATFLNNGVINLAATNAVAPFANMVNYVEEFIIEWKISFDGGNTWCEIGNSNNELYITLDTPNINIILPNNNSMEISRFFHTTLHYACINAIGLNEPDEIVDAIYSEFTDQEVRKLGSTTPLQYWREPITTSCLYVREFLKEGDARCGVWAFFFLDMLRFHNINDGVVVNIRRNGSYTLDMNNTINLMELANNTYPNNTIGYSSFNGGVRAYFNVKNWNVENATFYDVYDPDINSSNPYTFDWIPQDNNGNSVNLEGIAAQGNSDPYSFFSDHSIVKYNNKYYDPSYGTLYDNDTPNDTSDDIPFPSLLAWEDASINGFSCILCLMQPSETDCTLKSGQVKKMWTETVNNIGSIDVVEIVINLY